MPPPSTSGQVPISSGELVVLEPVAQQPLTTVERANANTIQALIKSHLTFLLTTSCMFPNETEQHELIHQSCLHVQSKYPHHNHRLVAQTVINKGSIIYTSHLPGTNFLTLDCKGPALELLQHDQEYKYC